MNKTISVHGILDSIATSKDRTLKIIFRTQELPAEEAGILHGLCHAEGYVAFSGSPIEAIEAPKEVKSMDQGKTPSRRLRAVLYVLWKQRGSNGDFESYYKQAYEKFIDTVKAQLEPNM